MIKLEDEEIPPCWVCGKVWKRKDASNWFSFHTVVVCLEHPGAEEFKNSTLKLAGVKMDIEMERD